MSNLGCIFAALHLGQRDHIRRIQLASPVRGSGQKARLRNRLEVVQLRRAELGRTHGRQDLPGANTLANAGLQFECSASDCGADPGHGLLIKVDTTCNGERFCDRFFADFVNLDLEFEIGVELHLAVRGRRLGSGGCGNRRA